MLELPLVFAAGILGSGHCLGMCGPFAIALGGGAKTWRHNLGRQLLYTLGRTFTYSVFGAAAGFGSWRLTHSVSWLSHLGAWLAIVAGAFLLFQGMTAAGFIPHRLVQHAPNCLTADFLRAMLRAPGRSGVFLAGMFTAFLPCGLVYGFLALAAASANFWMGSLIMTVFGLGTAPPMIAAGCGGSLLSGAARLRLLKIAAWCVVLTGAITIVRGVGMMEWNGPEASASCPFCD